MKQYRFTRPVKIEISDLLTVTLEDGRVIATPLDWYPWLASASSEKQQTIELLPDAVYWPLLNEGLEIEGMLRGIRPGENSTIKNEENA